MKILSRNKERVRGTIKGKESLQDVCNFINVANNLVFDISFLL